MALLTHLLACIFGIGSWMSINGVWVELPLLVNVLPEGWYLPSYLIIIIQSANVGPLFITLMHKWKPGLLSEVLIICVIVSTGVVACFLLAFLWHYTTNFGGARHSTAFLILTFFLSLVDCTSSVTFLPFMARFQPRYITSYFIGEGLSGLIPALFALAQGAGMSSCIKVVLPSDNTTHASNATLGNVTEDNHVPFHLETRYLPANFSSLVFFLILSGLMFSCLIAFFFLNRLPRVWELSEQKLCVNEITLHSIQKIPADGQGGPKRGFTDISVEGKEAGSSKGDEEEAPEKATYSWATLAFIYLLITWSSSLLFGVLPSVQSYSCLPYGNLAYHLSTTLGAMAVPLACSISMFLPSRSLPFLSMLAAAGTVFGAYNMGMAALSPCPLLHHSEWGDALIVISWVLFNGTLAYVKVMLGVILRDHSQSALVWYGATEQLGGLLGAVIMFPLVNVYNVFKSADYCSFRCPA